MGLIALTDPVFNLSARDAEIGWNGADRRKRLIHMMDAHVLGALPPYNQLLCGKLLACLVRSVEIRDLFREKYGTSEGIISCEKKNAQLLAITTSSSLGRSSVYNRLRLGDITTLVRSDLHRATDTFTSRKASSKKCGGILPTRTTRTATDTDLGWARIGDLERFELASFRSALVKRFCATILSEKFFSLVSLRMQRKYSAAGRSVRTGIPFCISML